MASLLTQAGESAPVFGAGAISGLQSEGDIVDFEIKRAKVINLGRRCTMTRQKGKGAHMRRVRWMHWCAFLLMLFLAAPVGTASAQQATGFYVSAYTGYVVPQNMNWDVTTAGVSFDVDTDSTGILGFKVGWVPPAAKYLALEMDFNYIFESNYGPTTVSGVTESGDIYLSNVLFNLLLRYPDGRIHPYIGGGIGWSYFNIEGFETVGGPEVSSPPLSLEVWTCQVKAPAPHPLLPPEGRGLRTAGVVDPVRSGAIRKPEQN